MRIWQVITVIGIAILLIIAGIWAFRYFTAPIRGSIGAYEQIQSEDTRIVAYNYFFNLYASIQAYPPMIKAQEESLAQTSNEDEKERIRANIAGLKSQLARSIAQYNADARKSYTIGQFRDWNLPYQINQ